MAGDGGGVDLAACCRCVVICNVQGGVYLRLFGSGGNSHLASSGNHQFWPNGNRQQPRYVYHIRFLRSRLLGGIRSFHPAGLQSHSFQLLSSETLALNGEHCSIIKDPVQSTQQGIVLIEVASPVRGMLVAGKYNIEVAFLVVSPVNQGNTV